MSTKRIVVSALSAAFLMSFSTDVLAEESRKAPAKELVQYIRDASRLGLTAAQIEQNAVRAGWPADALKDALAYVAESSPPPGNPAVSLPVPASAASPAEGSATNDAKNAASQNLQSGGDEYHIGSGDVLQISVWREPEASVGATVVRPDGNIGLPLLKEVQVVGLTPRQVEKIITDGLTKFIPAADVSVVVAAINSKKVYMVGAVKTEGPIKYTYRMTVMQAISEAGGLTDYAKRRKIYILRTQNGKDYKLPFDYEAVLKGERMELNVPLLAGDTLVVPH